jgi:D-alanine transaminase
MAKPYPQCFLEGRQQALADARISPLDRSFLFGDGVYEVIPVYDGRLFRFAAHAERLARSLAALQMTDPYSREQWRQILDDLVTVNGGGDQYVYVQVSRGHEEGRNHILPLNLQPTVFAYCAPWPKTDAAALRDGVRCITLQDTRWARCDIKSVALLANILLRQQATEAGATEAILLRDGRLTEGSASTVHVVLNGEIITPPNSHRILPGTTRGVVLDCAENLGLAHRTAEITESQLRSADEIWLASATREVQAVTRLDEQPVGTGQPGALWQRVYARYQTYKRES